MNIAEQQKKLKKLDPEASVTYFPMEGKYMGFDGRHGILTKFFDTREETTVESIKALEARQ
jgi:hypothetical protein